MRVALFVLLGISVARCRGFNNSRIAGGLVAQPGAIPYMVAVERARVPRCGGTLISDRIVLTAAHCVADALFDPLSLTVLSGSNTLTAVAPAVRSSVRLVCVSPQYSNSREKMYPHDVGLLLLVAPLAGVSPANLPVLDHTLDCVRECGVGTVCGWGTENGMGQEGTSLMCISAALLPSSWCQGAFPGETADDTVCARTISPPSATTCPGDAGGGIIMGDNTVAGIVSKEICVRGGLVVFTNVMANILYVNAAKLSMATGQCPPR